MFCKCCADGFFYILSQEKRQVAKEKLIEMEEEMAEATAQLKAREAEKIEKVSSVRLV